MNEQISGLLDQIGKLELEFEAALAKQRAELGIGLENGKIAFEEEILRRHRQLKTGFLTYIRRARILTILTAPVIYALIVPLVLLDLSVSLYQLICFPVYGIEKVRRRNYFVFDRRHLAYLNLIEKFNCAYCSYGNGLMAYAREIVARTEQYWCPIKHARRVIGTHDHYRRFIDYGDAEAFRSLAADDGIGKPKTTSGKA